MQQRKKIWAFILIMILSAGIALLPDSGLVSTTVSAQSTGYGEIRTTDYGTTPTSGGAYFWRGYSFKLTQSTTVTHLVGGGTTAGDQFAGAIFDANLDASGNPLSPRSVLRQVVFTGNTPNQVVAVSQITLQPDTWYYIAQGSLSTSSYLHWYVDSLDALDLVNASYRISHWMPDSAAPGQAHYWSAGDPSSVVAGVQPSTTPNKPALGFRYLSDASLPAVTTSETPMYATLTDRGNAPTALYIEYGTSPTLSSGTMLNLSHAGYEGPVPYTYGATATGLSPSTAYYYRARAINDAGRADGAIRSFTTPAPPGPPTINSITSENAQLTVYITPPAGGVDNYQYSLNNGSTWTSRTPASSSSPLVITGLTNGTTYSVRVRAVYQGIFGSASNMVTGTPSAAQTISFPTLSGKTYGDADFSPGATASSGLTVSYTSSNSDVAVISGGQIRITGSGTADITASQAGDSTYMPAPDVTQTLTVGKKTVSLNGGFSVASRTYDGLVQAEVSGHTMDVVGRISGDVLIIYPEAAFVDAHAGIGKPVNLTAGTYLAGSRAEHYILTLAGAPTSTGTIEKANLTLSSFSAEDKVYDGTDSVPVSGFADDRLAGDDLSFSYDASFADVNAGTDIPVNFSNVVISGGTHQNNYVLTGNQGTAAASIARRPMTIESVSKNKLYGEVDPVHEAIYTGFALGEDPATLGDVIIYRLVGEDVGSYPVNVIIFNERNHNYDITLIPGTFQIDGRELTVSGATVETRYYDGTTDAVISGAQLLGVRDSDHVILANCTTGTFAQANAGEGIAVSTSMTLSGTHAHNYILVDPQLSGTIQRRPVTIALDDQSKAYGESDPALTYQITDGSLPAGEEFSGSAVRDAGESRGVYTIRKGSLTLDSNYDLTVQEGTLTIGRRTIAVTADDAGKIYGADDPTLDYTITDGSLAFDDVFSGALSRQAGENAGSYMIEQGTLALNDNYNLIFTEGEFIVSKRPVTVRAHDKSKTYGETDPDLTYGLISGSLVFDDVFSGSLSRDAGEDAGIYSIGQGTLALDENYDLSFEPGQLDIGLKSITVTADAQTKVYGDADPALTFNITAGSLAFDDAFSGSLSRDAGEDVGMYDIQIGTLSAGNNYALTYVPAQMEIEKRALKVTAVDSSKIYRQLDPVFTVDYEGFAFNEGPGALDGMLNIWRQTGEDVGSYEIRLISTLTSSNYNIEPVYGTFEILRREIHTVGAAADDKVYDGTTAAVIHIDGLTAAQPGDTLGYESAASGTFAQKDAGNGIRVNTAITLTGAAAGNYTLVQPLLYADITARPVTVDAHAQSKVYGDTDPDFTYDLTEGTLVDDDGFSGVLSRDAGEDVGSYTIHRGSLTLGNNYSISFNEAEMSVSARPITVTADDNSKVYGNDDPALTYDITAGSLAFSDAFSGTLSREAGEDVGSYDIGQGTLALNNNYSLSFNDGTLSITVRPITVTADDNSKVYGNDDPALTYDITAGSLAFSDTFSGTLSRDAGEDVGSYDIGQGTLALNNNYSLSFNDGTLSITIRPISVTADDNSKVYGNDDPALTYDITAGSLAFSDTFSGTLSRDAGEDVGTYDIGQGTLTLNNNYSLSFNDGTLSISARPITVTGDDNSKVYGNDDPALTYDITAGSLAFSDIFSGTLSREAGEDVGSYDIGQGTLALNNNYSLSFNDGTLSITIRPITVTADDNSKVYGNDDPALTYDITAGSLAFSDTFSGTLSRDAGEDVGSYDIGQGTLALNNNYSLSFNDGTLSITARPITVTADDMTKSYGLLEPDLTYDYQGTLVGDDQFSGNLIRDLGEDVGNYAINRGSLTLGSNYNISYHPGTMTITPRPITVTADDNSKVYGNDDPALTYDITAGSLAFSDAFSGTLSREAGEDVGSYDIGQGTLALSSNYSLSFNDGTLSITVRPITVTADDNSKVYGNDDPALTYDITAGSLAFSDTFSGALSREAGEDVGSYDIGQGTLALSSNYSLSFNDGTLSITVRPITVTADDNSKVYGNDDPALTYDITAGSLAFSDTFSGALSREAGEDVGSYDIGQGTLALNNNYSLLFNDGTLSISARPISVTADDNSKVYGNDDPALTYDITAGSSGLQ
jgi:large repetitive protein